MHYILVEEVLQIHDNLLQRFSGLGGVKNIGQLESVLEHIHNDEYYPFFVDKATHLLFGIIMFHCFNDGNKRTAIATLAYFFEINDTYIPDLGAKLEDVVIGVAQGILNKDQLHRIIQSLLLSFGYL